MDKVLEDEAAEEGQHHSIKPPPVAASYKIQGSNSLVEEEESESISGRIDENISESDK